MVRHSELYPSAGGKGRVIVRCRRGGREEDARSGGQVGGVHAGPDKGPGRGDGGGGGTQGGGEARVSRESWKRVRAEGAAAGARIARMARRIGLSYAGPTGRGGGREARVTGRCVRAEGAAGGGGRVGSDREVQAEIRRSTGRGAQGMEGSARGSGGDRGACARRRVRGAGGARPPRRQRGRERGVRSGGMAARRGARAGRRRTRAGQARRGKEGVLGRKGMAA